MECDTATCWCFRSWMRWYGPREQDYEEGEYIYIYCSAGGKGHGNVSSSVQVTLDCSSSHIPVLHTFAPQRCGTYVMSRLRIEAAAGCRKQECQGRAIRPSYPTTIQTVTRTALLSWIMRCLMISRWIWPGRQLGTSAKRFTSFGVHESFES